MIALPLSGAQKCAVLLLLLDEPAAAALLRGLDPQEVHAVGDAMLSVAEIEPRAIDAVLDDFLDAHAGVASLGHDGAQLRSVMTEAFGTPRATALLGRLPPPASPTPFAALAWAEAATVAEIITGEHPQAGAVILAHLTPEVGTAVLAEIPAAARAGLIFRLARLGPVSATTLANLEADVEAALRRLAETRVADARGGTQVAARLLGGIDGQAELVAALRDLDAELAEEISQRLFIFSDLLRIETRALQAVVREIDPEVLVVALKGADAALRAHVLGAMSQRAAGQIEDDLAERGPLRRDEVVAAQVEIAAVVRRLADSGSLVLPGSGASYV